jgi:purine-binding chemotaxis protein CheW
VGEGVTGLWLLCRMETKLCALPLECVLETMRPLPVDPLPGAPRFILGLAIVRGAPIPVVSAAHLLGTGKVPPTRFVAVRAGERQVALAVDSVLGVRSVTAGSLRDLPPLLRDASAEYVAAIGTLDTELLFFLQSTYLVPEELWADLGRDLART